ncbi:Crp/Fnr family transcriptional regulator, partial [Haemophilus parainfluenzae]
MDARYGQRDSQADLQLIRSAQLFQGLPEEAVIAATSQVVTRNHPAN